MIFAWPELAVLHGRKTSLAREELVRALNALHDASDWHVAVVFDGRGSRSTEVSEPGGVQVFYSKSGQTADSLIERLTAKYAGHCAVTVATEDLMERTTVASLGGYSIGAVELRKEMDAARGRLSEQVRALRRRAGQRPSSL